MAKKSKQNDAVSVAIELDAAQYDRLQREAATLGITIDAFVREIVVLGLHLDQEVAS